MTEPAPKNGSKWWQTWLPLGASGVLVIGAMASYFGQQAVDASTIANLKTMLDVQTGRINEIQGSIERLQISGSENCRQLSTVEVQFGTVETVLNKTQVVNQRDISLLWNKVYGQDFPSTFYPVAIPHEAMPCVR